MISAPRPPAGPVRVWATDGLPLPADILSGCYRGLVCACRSQPGAAAQRLWSEMLVVLSTFESPGGHPATNRIVSEVFILPQRERRLF